MAPNARVRLGRRAAEEGARARRGKRLGTRVVAVRRSVGYLRVVGHTLGRCRLAYAYTQSAQLCSGLVCVRMSGGSEPSEDRVRRVCAPIAETETVSREYIEFSTNIYIHI